MTFPPTFRNQRDTAGEKELRAQQLSQHRENLEKLEGEIATAENDRKQFDAAVKRGRDNQNEHRFVGGGLEIEGPGL